MSPAQNHCILVVDDIADNLLLLQLILETEGYRVELADSGRGALSRIQASPPDLVLLDVMMPDMNGFEVVQHLRESETLSLLPIVLITADRNVDFEQALEVGANDVICKPIDIETLLTRVNAWCR
jgi:CheY-like chemotaxis protein